MREISLKSNNWRTKRERKTLRWKVDGTGQRLCPVVGYGFGNVGTSDSAIECSSCSYSHKSWSV